MKLSGKTNISSEKLNRTATRHSNNSVFFFFSFAKAQKGAKGSQSDWAVIKKKRKKTKKENCSRSIVMTARSRRGELPALRLARLQLIPPTADSGLEEATRNLFETKLSSEKKRKKKRREVRGVTTVEEL